MITIRENNFDKIIKRAIRNLKRNYGCPGNDGITYRDIKGDFSNHLIKIKELINSNSNHSLPSKIIFVDENKKRTIYVYSIFERIAQQTIKIIIEPVINNGLHGNVLSNKRGVDFKKEITFLLEEKQFRKAVLKIDIVDYYASIDKSLLLKMLIKRHHFSLDVIRFIEQTFSHCQKGIPPGNCLSPLLANFYLAPIDIFLKDDFIRFGDDIYIFLNSLADANQMLHDVIEPLKSLGLLINSEKIKKLANPIFEDFL